MDNFIESIVCHICGREDLEVVFDAPRLHLTGIYLPLNHAAVLPTFDQSLMFCKECGHAQLKNLIAPRILYDDSYTHRTSSSAIATSGNDFFYDNLVKITMGRKFNTLLEIGCNDLYLLSKMHEIAEQRIGIDPIWIGRDHELDAKTKILGRFIEKIDAENDIGTKPDLIVSSHTFEHIQDFYGQMSILVDLADDHCLFVLEIPNFDNLVKQRRFDQVFHQHIQYTSLSSMRRLVSRLGCTFLGHTFNYHYWGGTLLFWFEKGGGRIEPGLVGFEVQNIEAVKRSFDDFKSMIRTAVNQAVDLRETCFGYGGAQMLPVLAYHMESNLDFMDAILDDNSERHMTSLPGVSPIIRAPMKGEMDDAAVMITALDSARPILRRLLNVKPRRIIHPMQCF